MSSFNFDVITLFPKAFELINNLGVITKAREKSLIDVNLHDLININLTAKESIE